MDFKLTDKEIEGQRFKDVRGISDLGNLDNLYVDEDTGGIYDAKTGVLKGRRLGDGSFQAIDTSHGMWEVPQNPQQAEQIATAQQDQLNQQPMSLAKPSQMQMPRRKK